MGACEARNRTIVNSRRERPGNSCLTGGICRNGDVRGASRNHGNNIIIHRNIKSAGSHIPCIIGSGINDGRCTH